MQQYYGVCLDDIGRYSAWHLSALASQLPMGSRTMARIEPLATWDVTQHKLHQLLVALCGKEIPFPWDKRVGSLPEFEALPHDEFLAWYSQRFEEVGECQQV